MPEGLTGPVHVVGAGLLGTSVALACRGAGLDVLLSDISPENVRTASGLGAGRPYDGSPVQLVVVAVPPDHLGATVVRELAASNAVVTDVGSIKGQPLAEARVTGADLGRYVGSHPMAGSERSGPLASSGTLAIRCGRWEVRATARSCCSGVSDTSTPPQSATRARTTATASGLDAS